MATQFLAHPNNVSVSLGVAHAIGDGQLTVQSGMGSVFGNSFPMRVTAITSASYGSHGEVLTIFNVTSRNGDTLSVSDAVEGTSDQAFGIGDWVEVRWTNQDAKDIEQAVSAIENAPYSVDASVVHLTGTETISGSKVFSSLPTLGSLTGLVRASGGSLSARAESGWYNVKDYGATGDGVTDDLSAIQSAIDAASGVGGIVYFPASVYVVKPSTTLGIYLKSNVSLHGDDGAVIKVSSSAGDYHSVFTQSTYSVPVDNIVIEGLTIDQNASGNTTCDIVRGVYTTYQYGILLYYTTNLTIRNNKFFTCGINAIVANGSQCENVDVLNNWFSFEQARSTTYSDYDNSAVYLQTKTHRAIGNRFIASISQHARGAIETHNGQAVISGNTSDGYQTLCNICSTPNIGGSTRYNNDILVAGNVASGCNWGIQLWAYGSSTVLRNVNISDNVISVDQVAHNEVSCSAIYINNSIGNDGAVENILIGGNTIEFNNSDTFRSVDRHGNALTDYLTGGILLEGRVGGSGIIVANNIIRNSPGVGIKVGDTGLSYSNVFVARNQIVDCGINASLILSYRTAIFAYGSLTNVHIDDNEIIDTGVISLNGAKALYYHPSSADCNSFLRNIVWTASGIVLPSDIDVSKQLDSDDLLSYSTQDRTVNYQRIRGSWGFNSYTLSTESAGSAGSASFTLRSKSTAGGTTSMILSTTSLPFVRWAHSDSFVSSTPWYQFYGFPSGVSAFQTFVGIEPQINQSSTAGYTLLRINPTETTVGTGVKLLADFQVNGLSKFAISNSGDVIINSASGIKIGTATTQKLGFFNATPVVQQAGDIRNALSNLGLVVNPTYPVFIASGASHASGIVPDPGPVMGTTKFLREDATWQVPSGSGTVSSVAMTVPNGFSIAGSPITSSGTLALSTTLSGVLKGDGAGSILAATGDTDYTLPATTATKIPQYLASGYYFFTLSASTTGTSSISENTLRATPFYVPRSIRLIRIGAEVTGAGGAGSVIRLGIYSDNGSGFPGALVLDAGTIDGTSATVQEITISQDLSAGLYWIGSVSQVSASVPTVRTNGSFVYPYGMSALPTANLIVGSYAVGGVAGALPNPFGATTSSSASVRTFVKVQ